MAKLTLLEIVQRAMSAIDADNVEDIDETVESAQMVMLVNSVYERLVDDFPWYHKRGKRPLEITTTPNLFRIPDDVTQVIYLRYRGKPLSYLSPEKMDYMLSSRDSGQGNVDSVGAWTDRDPLYWTTYDDEFVAVDAYDGALVSALSDTFCILRPSKLSQNVHIPDLPDILHSALLLGVLEEAFGTLKGDEQRSQVYRTKFLKAIIKAKRWARRKFEEDSTWGVDYGRKRN